MTTPLSFPIPSPSEEPTTGGDCPREERFHHLFHCIHEGAALHRILFNESGETVDFEVLEANAAFQAHLGTPYELTAGELGSRIYNSTPPPFLDIYSKVALTGEALWFEAFLPEVQKHFRISVTSPAKHWFATIFTDVTEQAHQEQQARRLNRVLSKLNYAILRATSQDHLFREACDICIDSGGLPMAWIGIPDPFTKRFVPVASAGDFGDYLSKIAVYADERPEGLGPAGVSFRENRAIVCDDFDNDPRMLPWREVALEYDLRAVVALPILQEGKPFAVLLVYSGEKNYFHSKVLELLNEVAESLSFALDHLKQEERRCLAERRLSESEHKFRVLFETSRDAILIHDESSILECNPASQEMFGCASKEEFHSKALWDLSPREQPDGSNSKIALGQWHQLALKEGSQFFEWELRRMDGTTFPAEVLLTRLEFRGPKAVQAVLRDITERRAAEREVRDLSQAIAQSPVSVLITDLAGNIEYVNPKFTSITGYAPEEVLGQNPRIFQSGQMNPAVFVQLWKTITSGKDWQGELLNRKKNGELYWESVSISPIANRRGETVKYLSVKEDITERKQHLVAIEESETRFRQLTENLESVFWMANLNSHDLLYVSPAYEKIWGRSCESLFKDPESWLKAIHPEDRPRMDTIYREELSGKNYDETYRIIRPDGETRWVHDRAFIILNSAGEPYRAAGIAEDITESKLLHEQFLRVQRTESIGNLASGVAHDLNNILAPIVMSISILREQLTDPLNQELLVTIQESAERGAELIKQVLGFARGMAGVQANISAEQAINQVGRIVRKTFPQSISLKTEIPNQAWSINADLTQLHQVLLNLCVNARDAMPMGGALTIAAENRELDEHSASTVMNAKPGRFLVIKIIDTGLGIPKDILEKIFDPYFTTKQPGEGTGLGLSTVMRIVKSHQGFVKVESEPGKGTIFQIFLPAAKKQSHLATRGISLKLPQGNGACILLVDDEPSILTVMGKVLSRNGYKVLTARNGVEALTVYCSSPDKVELVVTDILMPQMDGFMLARGLRKLSPTLPIIASSGHSEESRRKEFTELGIEVFLRKPYSASELLHILDEVRLEGGSSQEGIQ